MSLPERRTNQPLEVELESNTRYAWCSCGHSSDQPFCDGQHKDEGGVPLRFTVDEPKKAAMCTCKLTSTPPYCDETHKTTKQAI